MQTIKLLTKDLEQLGELTEYASLLFTRSWHGVGEFQLVIHREANLANAIQKDCLVALDKNKVAIVKHREIQLDENGKATENWLFRGWSLKGLMEQRITIPPLHAAYDHRSGNAETVMKHYIDKHFVNPVDSKRKVPNLVIAPNQNRGGHINWQSRFKVVSDELTEISMATGLGWDIALDTEKNNFVFDVVEGINRSDNQNERSKVFFSPEFGNVRTQSFSDSDLNMRNVGYVAGQGEGIERKVIELGNVEGFNRYETFIDARDIGNDEGGEPLPPVEEERALTERGQQKLDEMKNEMFFEAQIMSPIKGNDGEQVEPFVYEKDYNLGDIVTVVNREWDFIVDKRLTEVTEVYEIGGFQLEAVFGQNKPTLISKLKSKFSDYDQLLLK